MWTVNLPETGDIDEQLDSALKFKNGESVYALDDAQRAAVHRLYAEYDHRLGEPDPALKPAPLADCADALHDAYDQVQIGGRLESLRKSLLAAVLECPLCGSGPATTLDHHLPRGEYRVLSINPRNLVPICQPCNRAKGTLVPVAGQGMIHAYFQQMPNLTFLRADATYVAGALTVEFVIDRANLEPALADRLAFQLGRMKLNERHPAAINLYLFGLKAAFEMLRGKSNERDLLQELLLIAARKADGDLGLNHWRAALLHGLAACDAFLDDPWAYLDSPPAAMRAR